AYILLVNQEMLKLILGIFSGNDETVAEEIVEEQKAVDTNEIKTEKTPENPAPKAKEEKKSTNAAADGLSRFYASINPDFDDNSGPRIRDNIVYLPDPKGDLSKILTARKKVTSPLRKSWRGDRAPRPFRVGETLYQKLSEYAQTQGIEVMWRLNRDFLIKDPFRIDQNLVKTAYQVGKAVEGHFENGISIYFCYQHRVLVLIDQPDNYLAAECMLVTNQQSNW
ncbi:MAG: TcpQ domain-containing protein, partial [Thalassotalea sp.]